MTKIGIFGAAGYGGVELIRLLLEHPEIEIAYLGGHTTAGENITDLYPSLLGRIDMAIGESSLAALEGSGAEVLCSALPHKVGADIVAEALDSGLKVIDFSADFRLKDAAEYEKYYQPHPHPELLAEAVYGLPELHRKEIIPARLVAAPGCYPTGAILALAPAVKAGLIESQGIIVDSKSGVSGAGRSKVALAFHFPELNESMKAYSVAAHRHTPEMDQELSALSDEPIQVTFAPHLMPVTRGILTTTYGRLRQPMTEADVREVYQQFYANEPFVEVMPAGIQPTTKQVNGSNNCHIGLVVAEDTGWLIATSAIDNLIKGLSGSVLQCLNLMIGCAETTALDRPALWP